MRRAILTGASRLQQLYATLTPKSCGGASGAISTGKLQGALLGAAQAIAFYGVGSGLKIEGNSSILGSQTADAFVAHGAVGGLFSIGQKGGFSSGFLAAGIGSLADGIDTGDDMVAGVAVHAVAGGLGSLAGGGKFLNGAESGAFGYLFNSLAHAWAGTAANQALGQYLNQRDNGIWLVNSSFWGVLLDGRADLIDTLTKEVYEIKTNFCLQTTSCLEDAKEQLDDYIDDANKNGKNLSQGSDFTVFKGAVSIGRENTVMGVQTNFVFSPYGQNTGLIGYDRDVNNTWEQEVMHAWATKKFGPGPVLAPAWEFALP